MGERTDAVTGNDRTDEIRRDIERTQREMSRTIDEIQHRLSPHYMMQRTKDSMREAGVKASRSFGDRVRNNPIGATMVGVGLWMLMRDNDRDVEVEFIPDRDRWDASLPSNYSSVGEYRDFDYEGASHGRLADARERVSGIADTARERVSGVADTTRERVSSAMHSVHEATSSAGEGVRHLSERARHRMQRARYQSRDLMTDSPLVVGLAAIAAGALLGALIPETERENELMGEHRDRLAERAREMAREGVDRARDVARAATTAAPEAARSEIKSDDRSRTDVGTNVGIGTQI